MPGGQGLTSAHGSVGVSKTVALIGLALAMSQGVPTASGANGVVLSGQAITAQTGSVSKTVSILPVGQFTEVRQGVMFGKGRSIVSMTTGTAVPTPLIALSGQAIASSGGLVFPNNGGTIPLVGTSATVTTGSVLIPQSQALTGLASTASAGTVGPVLTPTVSAGQVITSAMGSATASGSSPIDVHLSGVEAQWSQGTVSEAHVVFGSSTPVQSGTLLSSRSLELLGQQIGMTINSMGIGQDPNDTRIDGQQTAPATSRTVPLAGTAITSAQGSVGLSNNVFQAITGIGLSGSTGIAGVVGSVPLLGSEASALQSNLGAPGGATLVGQAVTMQQGTIFTTQDRAMALTGVSATVAHGGVSPRLAPSLLGSPLASGTGQMGRSGGNMQQVLTGQAATTQQTTPAISGQDQLPDGVSTEGCSVTTTRSPEGCGITKTRSCEENALNSRPSGEA